MSKAFDSVSKPLIVLSWQRLGLPVEIAQWLVDLDASGYTIVRTPYALSKWDIEGLGGIRALSFNPKRGTRQGDIHSPFTWLAVFDVLLTALDRQPVTDPHFMVWRPDASATLPGPFAMPTTSSPLPRRCLAYRTLRLWSLCALWSSIFPLPSTNFAPFITADSLSSQRPRKPWLFTRRGGSLTLL